MSRRHLTASSALTLLLSLCLAPSVSAQQSPAGPVADAPADAPDVVVVTGQRAAQKRGIETQRNADNFIEALSGDDAGKLPDGNVAEAVKRLPGVSVANDQGEGRYVIIRGANPALANVTINGQTAAAPEPEGRQVKLDDVPSALIGSVVLTESLTADLDANAIAGQVNINTVTAFDRAGDFYQARLAAGTYDLSGKSPYEGDLTVGKRFGPNDEFGVVGALNYSTRPIRSENLQGSSDWRTIGGVQVPDDYRPRLYNLTRERTGAVLNLDWRPTDVFRAYIRTTYSKFTDHETRDQFRIEIPATFTAGSLTADGGDFVNARMSRFLRLRNEDDNTINSTVGGQYSFGASTLKVEGGYTRAEKTDPLRSEFVFRGSANAATGVSGHLDLTDERFLITPTGTGVTNFNDPSKLSFNSVNYDRREAVETLWQGRVDYEMPVSFSFGDVKFAAGAKVIDREKTNDRNILTYQAPSSNNWTLAGLTGDPGQSTFDGRYAFGPTVDYNLAQAFIDANPTRVAVNTATTTANSLVNDYEVGETITAGYAMATLKFDKWTIIPGVRVEHTASDYKAKVFTTTSSPTQGYNATGDDSYTDVFPGLNVRYDFSDQLLFRGAITTAIGRPDYAQLPPYASLDQGALTASLGNPNLEPLKAVNYDLGASWYPWEGAVVSVGVFEKLIDSPIYSQGAYQTNVPGAASPTDLFLVTQSKNAASAKITGIDFNAQMQFTMLPGGFDGLGVAFTYTSIDGEARGVQRVAPASAAGAAVFANTPLFFQSPEVGTAQLFYEKYGVTARIAYSYRAAYLDTVGTSSATDQYTDANGQLDMRVAYDINKHIQLFAEGSNLNDATWRRYEGVKRQTIEEERYSWSARVGATVKY